MPLPTVNLHLDQVQSSAGLHPGAVRVNQHQLCLLPSPLRGDERPVCEIWLQAEEQAPEVWVESVHDGVQLICLHFQLKEFCCHEAPVVGDDGAARNGGLEIQEQLDLQQRESGDMGEVLEVLKTQARDRLKDVCVLDVQVAQVHISPVVIRVHTRGELPFEKVVAVLVPVCTEHSERYQLPHAHVIGTRQTEHIPFVFQLGLDGITRINSPKRVDKREPGSHVRTRSRHGPERANGIFVFECSGRGEKLITRVRPKFLIFGFELGAFLGHGAASGFVAGEVGGLVFTAAVEHDLAAGAAHQVVGAGTDAALN